jgi:ABC-type uncharacterized transport system substrate-binding protein
MRIIQSILSTCYCRHLLFIPVLFGIGCSVNFEESVDSKKSPLSAYQTDLKDLVSSAQQKKVLVVHSYHPSYDWVPKVNDGIKRGFQEEGYDVHSNLVLEYFYMDTKRNTSESWKKEMRAAALDRVNSWQPDLVITVDDNAAILVAKKLKDSDVPVVFSGVNGDPVTYGLVDSLEKPGHNITGCVERERFPQTLALLRKLSPKPIRRMAILYDESPTGSPPVARIKQQVQDQDLGIEIVAELKTDNLAKWKKFVKKANAIADVLCVSFYFTVKDDAGRHVHQFEVLDWTQNNLIIPDIGFWEFNIDAGITCADAISGYQQGHYAASVSAYILMGQSPAEFAVDSPRRGEICINRGRTDMLGWKIPQDVSARAKIYELRKAGEYMRKKT